MAPAAPRRRVQERVRRSPNAHGRNITAVGLLLPLLLGLAAASAGCVTYDGVDQDGKHSKSRTLIECRQSGAVACRMLPDVTYMRLPK